MSPPCVAFWEGNNGGATWVGVTRDEIRVVYWSGMGGGTNSTNCNASFDCSAQPNNKSVCDLNKPPNTDRGCFPAGESDDHWFVRSMRPLVSHFNTRYQTYGRRVHVWIYFSLATSSAERRAEAAEMYAKFQPFALLPQPQFMAEAMAQRKVLSFASSLGAAIGSVERQPASAYANYAPYLWSFGPDVEHWVDGYGGYACSRLAGKPVSHTTGNDRFNQPMKGKPRKYAYMYTTDRAVGNNALQFFKDQVRPKLRACGLGTDIEVTFPLAGFVANTGGDNTYAARNVAKMRDNDVTTVLWFGGLETYTGQAADQVDYFPEIVLAGDGNLDGILGGEAQNQNWWRNAWGYTPTLYQGERLEENPSYQACKEGDPGASSSDCATSSITYRIFFILFKAIQAAGPRISPTAVDAGMHALPKTASTNPFIGACYFDPRDYTCLKDGVEIWWDPNARSTYWNGNGCMRMTRGGKRFLADGWSGEDIVFQNPQDPCSPVVGNAGAGAGTPEAPS